MHLPNSAPLVGGLVLTLMTLPTIIISTRASLKSVPPSIRDAALGVGASKMQSVFHHVLPLAAPGILTGTIIGLAQALWETAPLLLIGMVGFIASNPPESIAEGLMSPNSAMPAQIYEWAKRADPAFYERAWGGIIILLVFLISMNAIAVLLRRRFERRW
ncbi:MAG: PstA family ABC transporter permease, partial [Sulfitobacter sp.]